MENQPTTKQLILFTVVLSFIVSMIGTVLVLGVFGPIFGSSEGVTGPFVFNRPKILDKIVPTITPVTQEELVVKAVDQASPAVVSVVASKDVPVIEQFNVDPFSNDPFFQQFFGGNGSGFSIPQFRQNGTKREDVSAGSGFLVSADGLILTNKHVVSDKAADYTILLNDGTKKTAKVLALDPLQDLAVLKIEGSNYPFLQLGDSSQIKIGQTAIAIGNALGEFRNTVSVGVISGLERSVVAQGATSGSESLQELVQTDAAINPGNSGGPLLNLQGQVVAIDTAIAQGAQNIGFAIPINKAKRDIDNVSKLGKIIYPYIGVRYVTITPQVAAENKLGRNYGAWVTSSGSGGDAVVPGSPAEKAGIRAGDIILEANGEKVGINNTLAAVLQKYSIGDELTLKVFRDSKEIEIKVKLEEYKP